VRRAGGTRGFPTPWCRHPSRETNEVTRSPIATPPDRSRRPPSRHRRPFCPNAYTPRPDSATASGKEVTSTRRRQPARSTRCLPAGCPAAASRSGWSAGRPIVVGAIKITHYVRSTDALERAQIAGSGRTAWSPSAVIMCAPTRGPKSARTVDRVGFSDRLQEAALAARTLIDGASDLVFGVAPAASSAARLASVRLGRHGHSSGGGRCLGVLVCRVDDRSVVRRAVGPSSGGRGV
jgi:hypothetical protein